MKKVVCLFTLVTIGQGCGEALSADKVVVVPLMSAKRTTCDGPDEVLSQGQCWKDRNLGATRVAQSMGDTLAYGDLYQWGRLGDGHQNRTIIGGGPDGITATISGTDVPGHSNFIWTSSAPYDWRSPENTNLWQGIGGVNNPCPQGFRIPTEEEFERERVSWSGNNASGAYNSPLKLVTAGFRQYSTWIYNTFYGYYWTSTADGTMSRYLFVTDTNASMTTGYRGVGYSIRCIKE